MKRVRHTRFGWWLEEAGAVDAAAPREGDTTADVVVVGGGYLGLWTAWHLKQLEPDVDVVVLDAGLAGHGPSGRNGGFVSTLWDDLPILRERVGDEQALAVARASERGVPGIGQWCESEGVDAWYRAAPTLYVATSEPQLGAFDDAIQACKAVGAPEEIRPLTADEPRARCDAAFLGGAIVRTSATVAFRALGLRAEELGWTGGEPIADGRTLLHYTGTTQVAASRSGGVAGGWASAVAGSLGSRSIPMRRASRATTCFVSFHGSAVVASRMPGAVRSTSPPTHLPVFGSRGRNHGFGFTGNGVGPGYLGGEILARLALDRRDELTRLALVEPDSKLMPPEPLRSAGSSLIRSALARTDEAEDAGRRPGPFTRLVATAPRRLGLRLPR